ncbi:hypothetical protein LIA77_09753 [Sarocladium implicatum]|nr:hypothetical protein LIA77_09753 [Sarocladium implicatum]
MAEEGRELAGCLFDCRLSYAGHVSLALSEVAGDSSTAPKVVNEIRRKRPTYLSVIVADCSPGFVDQVPYHNQLIRSVNATCKTYLPDRHSTHHQCHRIIAAAESCEPPSNQNAPTSVAGLE